MAADGDAVWSMIGRGLAAMGLPVERIRGEWLVRLRPSAEPHEDDEPDAYVVWAEEPSPETGHGWCWWALGQMGEAPSLRSAMDAADRALCRDCGNVEPWRDAP